MKFLLLEEVLAIHEQMLEIGGGREGIRDFTLLHSAIERPKAQYSGQDLYPSIWLMAAAMLQSLVKNHPFEDGNKRTAYFSTMRFLRKNGYFLEPKKEKGIIKFMIEADTKNKNIEQIAVWLRKNSKRV